MNFNILTSYSDSSSPTIHKLSVKTNKYMGGNTITIPIYVKYYLSGRYKLTQSILEIQMLTSADSPNYLINLSKTNRAATSINIYSNQCIILNYGNRIINSINVLMQEMFSDDTGISPLQALSQSGLVFFVSDQNYDLFMSDPIWSQLGNNLRRLSEFNEVDWQ